MATTPKFVPSDADVDSIEDDMKRLQDYICTFLQDAAAGQRMDETLWTYEKGTGGGRSRVFETERRSGGDQVLHAEVHPLPIWEKGGCNFSGIKGFSLPDSAVKAFNVEPNTPYRATGVSLIIHPSNPMVPTIHMNVRFFCCGDRWWFGGGVDVTPHYPILNQAILFHQKLREVCERHKFDYEKLKTTCDEYFYLPHRKETRGIGGLFYDSISDDFAAARAFTFDLGRLFVELYSIFIPNLKLPFTAAQRQFMLYRRGRYVEFNLLYDRGTKFGLTSGGRIESILVSLPSTVHWVYEYTPKAGSDEEYLYKYYLRAQNWLQLTDEQKAEMTAPWLKSGTPACAATVQTEPADAQCPYMRGTSCCGKKCCLPFWLLTGVAGAAVGFLAAKAMLRK